MHRREDRRYTSLPRKASCLPSTPPALWRHRPASGLSAPPVLLPRLSYGDECFGCLLNILLASVFKNYHMNLFLHQLLSPPPRSPISPSLQILPSWPFCPAPFSSPTPCDHVHAHGHQVETMCPRSHYALLRRQASLPRGHQYDCLQLSAHFPACAFQGLLEVLFLLKFYCYLRSHLSSLLTLHPLLKNPSDCKNLNNHTS